MMPSGWLAVSHPSEPLEIGFVGENRPHAEAALRRDLKTWAILRGQEKWPLRVAI
jgi:hypothetical protein